MKQLKIYPLLFFCLFFTGCIYDNVDDCPVPGNLTLSFYYLGDGTDNIFSEKIEKMEVYIFDENDNFLIKEDLNHKQLQQFQGIYLSLPKGNYRVICWGNTNENSYIIALNGDTHLSAFRLFHPNFLGSASIPTIDPLYYASRTIHVQEDGAQENAVYFSSAHIGLEIYMEGFTENIDKNSEPVVEIENLFSGYRFEITSLTEKISYYPRVRMDKTGKVYLAQLDVPRFPNRNDISIDIKNGENSIYTLSLNDFMHDNRIEVEGFQEIIIPIYIKISKNNVSVSVAEWDGVHNVKPSF